MTQKLQDINPETGEIREERYIHNGLLHRPPSEGPAATQWHWAHKEIAWMQGYAVNGAWHRSDGPAVIRFEPATGIVIYEGYFHSGQLHRADGPAEIIRDGKTGFVQRERYFRHGKLHRASEDGPADAIYFRTNEAPVEERYFFDGHLHRKNGPAHVRRDARSSCHVIEDYYQHGRLHRPGNQPALLRRNPDTEIVEYEAYFRNGVCGQSASGYGHGVIQRDGWSGEVVLEEIWRNGVKVQEHHYQFGEPHQPGKLGPAKAFWSSATGNLHRAEYWEHGVRMDEPKSRLGRPLISETIPKP